MSAGRRWFLSRRVAAWFVAVTVTFVAALVGASAWFMHGSAVRELDALVVEEVDEMQAFFAASDGTPEAFRDIARRLAENHSANPMAWGVWERGSAGPWAVHGAAWVAAELPAGGLDAARSFEASGESRRWRLAPLGDGLWVGCLIDGSAQMDILRRTLRVMLVIGVIATLVAAAVGMLFGRSVARLMEDVAESARRAALSRDARAVRVQDAPEEIHRVTSALEDILGGIQRERERTSLLTTGLAHELGAPIQNLLGETEVALLRDREPEEYRRVLESHREEILDLKRVLGNLIVLSATQSARGEVAELFDIGQLADDELQREREDAGRRGVEILVRAEGDLSCRGDREAVLLSLRNLVRNAVQWSPPGATVRVDLIGDDAGIRIEVDDEGPGVPEGDRAQIFEPFTSRARNGAERGGYGIGLALVRSAFLAHGGDVDVEDSPRGGARFRARLPCER